MSFSNNCSKLDKIPGPLKGNPMGLCEKACIEVKKVFDACIKQSTEQNVKITALFPDPNNYKAPYKFISAKSYGGEQIKDLVVTPSLEDSCFARVTCNIDVPINIVFKDANGVEGVVPANMVIPKDVMLHISAPSLIPYHIEAIANIICPEGCFIGETADLLVSACTTVILKVVMPVDLLVPTYGYCYIPPCQEYTEEVCDGVFDLPLFPGECGIEERCKNC